MSLRKLRSGAEAADAEEESPGYLKADNMIISRVVCSDEAKQLNVRRVRIVLDRKY